MTTSCISTVLGQLFVEFLAFRKAGLKFIFYALPDGSLASDTAGRRGERPGQ